MHPSICEGFGASRSYVALWARWCLLELPQYFINTNTIVLVWRTGSSCMDHESAMATNSPIEWTDATWNPVTGCDKISPGCKHCYAERMAHRLKAMGQANYRNGFELTLQPHMLEL